MEQTFVDDERLGPHPTSAGLVILPDSVSELLRFFAPQTNTGKGMDGHTTDVARGDT